MSKTETDDIEAFIREVFEENYEILRAEENRAVAPDVKDAALNQVLLYWRKMQEVAENITDTEVKLGLPGQKTPKGRPFTIEGVVDIVRDNDRTVMYDIKTHDADYVRANREIYERQLNVYANIWQELRGQPLDECAVIATDYPELVKRALGGGDDAQLEWALNRWEPLIPIPFDRESVGETIEAFGVVVDAIEDGEYTPPPLETLQGRMQGNEKFGTRVCRNCDARFSCTPYRRFVLQGQRGGAQQFFREYFNDEEQENWRTSNLSAMSDIDDLMTDFANPRA